ncbi:hypothetical protein [Microtetraspora malaysiensis]|uniref:Uncharacterized protein n=1 Tax=Microtetraspora malaysiensis TaxID=161358 RepID=A0ABW6T6D5_9ACTN
MAAHRHPRPQLARLLAALSLSARAARRAERAAAAERADAEDEAWLAHVLRHGDSEAGDRLAVARRKISLLLEDQHDTRQATNEQAEQRADEVLLRRVLAGLEAL